MEIFSNHSYDTDFIVTNDQVIKALNNFKSYPSIVIIKSKIKIDQCFSFGPVTYDDILKKTNNLNTAKTSQQSDIPTKILKQNSDFFTEYVCGNTN